MHGDLMYLKNICSSKKKYYCEKKSSKIKFTVATVYIMPSIEEKSKIIKLSAYSGMFSSKKKKKKHVSVQKKKKRLFYCLNKIKLQTQNVALTLAR